MKHISFVSENDGSALKKKVEEWIESNKGKIKEVVRIEYEENANVFFATITYLE